MLDPDWNSLDGEETKSVLGLYVCVRHWWTGGCVRGILRRCEGERFRAAEEVFGGCMVGELQERWGNRFNSERMPTAFLRDAWWLD